MNCFSCTAKLVPVAQPRPRFANGPQGVHTYSNPHDHPVYAYKLLLRQAVMAVFKDKPWDGRVQLKISFILPHIVTKVKGRSWHSKRPDLDNLAKAVLDALNGLVYNDDSQVCHLTLAKVYAGVDEEAAVIISAARVTSPMLWDVDRLPGEYHEED